MFYVRINKENNKVIGFEPSTTRLVTVDMDELPKLPDHPKPGINYVEYYNPQTKKIELREEPRPLTEQEKAAEKQKELESQVLNLMEALAEIHEGGGA